MSPGFRSTSAFAIIVPSLVDSLSTKPGIVPLPCALNASIVAGLNRARKDGHVGNPDAWKLDPLNDDVENSGDTAVLLTPKQRTALIKAASQSVGAFLRGLELTGARPGELASAKVADLDIANGVLTLSHRKGRPAKLRYRAVVLGDAGVAHFKSQAKSKLPTALLYTTATGTRSKLAITLS